MSLGGLLIRIGNFDPEAFNRNFDERLILQKTIYLLQASGLYLGYPFSWYIKGPYSPELASDAYSLAKVYDRARPVRFENLESEKRFRHFMSFLGNRSTDADWLERLASIHFLKTVHARTTKEDIIARVMRKQRYLTPEKCEEAWNYLEKYGLL